MSKADTDHSNSTDFIEYNLTSVSVVLKTDSGRTFGFSSGSISFLVPEIKVGSFVRTAILTIKVGEGTLSAAKEMEELQKTSLGIEKSVIRNIRKE